MHPHGVTPAPLSSSLWPLDGVSYAHPESMPHASLGNNPSTTSGSIHLLSVGRIEPPTLIHSVMLDLPDFAISMTRDYRELWITSQREPIEIALLHNTLCSFELAEAAPLIRSRWPRARILVIRSGEMPLDRTLYDDRLHPPVAPEILIDRLSRLGHELREGGHGNR